MVNNEPIKGGTFIPNDPINPNETQQTTPMVSEPIVDMSNQSVVQTTATTSDIPTQAPMSIPGVQSNTTGITNSITEQTIAPITPTQTLTMMENLPQQPAQVSIPSNIAPASDLMAQPNNMNIGQVAEPLAQPTPIVPETPKFNVEIPIEAPISVSSPVPEVAQVSSALVMENTEIETIEPEIIETIDAPAQVEQKKEPMFVLDMPEENKNEGKTSSIHQDIVVDVPEMEELI